MNDTPASLPVLAYIGIGSNMDEPVKHVREAIGELHQLQKSHCETVSSLYSNPPMGPQDQPDYVNAVVELNTYLSPYELLAELQALEDRHGRVRSAEQWGPRTLDLDIILYGDEILQDPDLSIPHPGAHERAFVLYPLLEIHPEIEIPGRGKARDLVEHTHRNTLYRLDVQR